MALLSNVLMRLCPLAFSLTWYVITSSRNNDFYCKLRPIGHLRVGEVELQWLDMQINVGRSVCMKTGPRFNAIPGRSLYTVDGNELKWSDSIRYLGVYHTSLGYLAAHLNMLNDHFVEFLMVYSVQWVASHLRPWLSNY